MGEWIYSKSDNLETALALSVCLDSSPHKFNLVRKSRWTSLFSQHPSINVIGHPKEDDAVIHIKCEETLPFNTKVEVISQVLGISCHIPKEPAFHLGTPNSGVFKALSDKEAVLLYLTQQGCQQLDLFFIDEACRLLIEHQYQVYSVGDFSIPCIRGCQDFRSLLDLDEIITLIRSSKALITNNAELSELASLLCKNSFLLIQKDNAYICNGGIVTMPSQVSNMILKTIE